MARPVRLQKKRRGQWVTIKKGTSDPSGDFTLRRSLKGADGSRVKVRVAAPPTRVGDRSYARIVTKARLVRFKRQSVRLSLPKSARVGSKFVVRAKFTPVRPGRRVVLQERRPTGGWAVVGRGTQNRKGTVRVRVPAVAVGSFSFRMRARNWGGLAPKTTGTKTVRVRPDPNSNAPLGVTTRVKGSGDSTWDPDISDDGRFVPYTSWADWEGFDDDVSDENIFVRDQEERETRRLTPYIGTDSQITSDGRMVVYTGDGSTDREDIFVHDVDEDSNFPINEGEGDCGHPAISDNGRFVAYETSEDPPGRSDNSYNYNVVVHNLETGTNTWLAAGNRSSTDATISSSGRFVAFESDATNLTPGDNNRKRDIFLSDRRMGTTTRITAGNKHSHSPEISGNGRFITFGSSATNLAPGRTNKGDVFVYDRKTEETTRLIKGNGLSSDPSISSSGRYVAFSSQASNLVKRDINRRRDVFLHDRKNATTTRITDGNDYSNDARISDNGRFIAFTSFATNLVRGDDPEGYPDNTVLVHERVPR